MAKLTCVLIYLCCFVPFTLCSTVRHAKVRIENKSSKTLSAVRVNHAYGSIFKQRNSESHTWTNVAPGAHTDASLQVEYLTGDSGADWWQVGWTVLGEPIVDKTKAGSIKFRQTRPANAQGLVDEFFSGIGGDIAFAIKDILSSDLAGAYQMILDVFSKPSDVYFAFFKTTVELLMPAIKKSNLVGYKQCMLTKGDRDRIVNIRIYDSGSKVQISPADSSNCDTVWKLISVPWSTNGIFKRGAVATRFEA